MAMQSYMRGVIAGMELAMRICRNRAQDYRSMGSTDSLYGQTQAAETCAGCIRITQVEIGAGRMPLPEFTQLEQEEINRIR
jgi:hypothetical protein